MPFDGEALLVMGRHTWRIAVIYRNCTFTEPSLLVIK